MKSDVFYSFFLSMTKYVKNKKSTVNNICKQYEYATHIKRKRIKLKKEKEVLLSMYEFLFDNFIKK
jgi:hypothetical protein